MKVTNQHQQVLYYLIRWDKLSLKTVINDSLFYKFQTRLGEIEKKHGVLCERTKKSFINRFGRDRKYTEYRCIDKEKAAMLFLKYMSKK